MTREWNPKKRIPTKSPEEKRRLRDIFTLIDKGETSNIPNALANQERRAQESVQNVIETIKVLENVRSIQKANALQESQGADLIITLTDGYTVFVQVKSSTTGVKKFISVGKNTIEYKGEDRKIFVINGQKPKEEIQRLFTVFLDRYSKH